MPVAVGFNRVSTHGDSVNPRVASCSDGWTSGCARTSQASLREADVGCSGHWSPQQRVVSRGTWARRKILGAGREAAVCEVEGAGLVARVGAGAG